MSGGDHIRRGLRENKEDGILMIVFRIETTQDFRELYRLQRDTL